MLRISKALIDGTIDLLLDMAQQSLPAPTARGGQLLDPFFLQAHSQFRFAAAFGAISLVTRAQVFMERAVLLAGTGRHEIGYAHIDPHDRRTRNGVLRDFFIIGEGEPPDTFAPIELHAAIELSWLLGPGVDQDTLVIRGCFWQRLRPPTKRGKNGHPGGETPKGAREKGEHLLVRR